MTAGIGLGLEPPLSPPVVRGHGMAAPMLSSANLSDLPTPPPAIRPPEAPALGPAPAPQAEVPHQPEPVQPEQAPVPAQPEQVLPLAAPEPVQLQTETPAAEPEPELPAMAPVEEAVIDYFAPPEPAAETLPEIAPVEDTPAEPVRLTEIEPIPPVAPALPVEEPAAELPTMAPVAPAVELAPDAFFAPKPEAEVQAAVEPEVAREPMVFPEPELRLPDDPFEAALPAPEPVTTPEPEKLFAPKPSGKFCVVVRLKDSDGVEVGEFRDFGTAMEGAQEVIEQFSNVIEGQWPFYAGRFIRPDLIVSVDVVEGQQTD